MVGFDQTHSRPPDELISIDPATEEFIARFDPISDAEAVAAVETSSAAFQDWRRRKLPERAAVLHDIAAQLRKRADDHAELVTREMGKPITQARGELAKCAAHFDFYAINGAEFLNDESVATSARRGLVAFEPLGPILAIMPWNAPFSQVSRFAAPALMAGNTCLLKHASNVTLCALAMQESLLAAGLPAGVFQTLLLPASRVSPLIADDRVRGVTVTGGSRAGAAIAATAGAALKKCVLELGGSDPFIVLDGADLTKAAATAAQSRLGNSGQMCAAGKRFIVTERVAAEFEELFREAIGAKTFGDPKDPTTEVGPLARADLVDAIDRQVRESIAMGARLVLGGRRRPAPGYFYEPTLLADCTPRMPVFREETFGPVAALATVADPESALALANDTPYGLAGSIWTEDLELAERLARRLDAGSVYLNSIVTGEPSVPFGGVKASGFGRENGRHGIREFVNVQAIVSAGALSAPV